jgi:hydrogenase expression/formation protein HypC
MCIGLPMQVLSLEPGHALCQGMGEKRRVRTALVGDVQPGDWLLVFLDDAREKIDPLRAAEVEQALALVANALHAHKHAMSPSFDLPSALSLQDIQRLAGQA